jgi:hypothetical protein
MIATNPNQLSLPALCVLCGLCVKSHLQPHPVLTGQRIAKPRRICTCAKFTRNLFTMSTSKTKDLESCRIRTYKKTGEGGTLTSSAPLVPPSFRGPLPNPQQPGLPEPPWRGATVRTRRNARNPLPLMHLLHNSRTPPGGGYRGRPYRRNALASALAPKPFAVVTSLLHYFFHLGGSTADGSNYNS